MNAEPPDTTGYPLEEAREMLAAAGYDAIEVSRVGRDDELSRKHRVMVIRQRPGKDGAVDLTVAAEWRTPIRQES
ncbi:MAG: PASTA domain-containing protein [Armatimonadota bacterium]